MFAFVHNNILPQEPQDGAASPVLASIQNLYLQAVVAPQKAPDPRVVEAMAEKSDDNPDDPW
jgi:hypothetical protein